MLHPVSSSLHFVEQLKTGGSRISFTRFRALQRKVNTIDAQVESLTSYLTINDCASNPCLHGGTCVDAYNGFICQCPSNWEGPTCQVDVNECARFAGTSQGCQNGATCINTEGSYRCECSSNWYGIHCTESHDDCTAASHYELCGHGTCVNEKRIVPGQSKYRCICDEGWTKGTGPACDQDVDECAGNTHSCSKNPAVACINLPGTFACGHCPSGYTGNGYSCQDINECASNNGGCHHLVTCINTIGSRQCGSCPAGYLGNGMHCSFVGVCGVNRGGCHPLATCIENSAITGTFRECRCPAGYIGNGEGLTGCVQGDSSVTCTSNPCIHGTCQMTSSSYYCVCYPGFTGTVCDQPVSPCVSQPCQNGGTCTSQGNTFTCACTESFEGPTCNIERQSCGGYLLGTNGTITYPTSVGTEYRHQENCGWVIVVNETEVVNVTLNAIHIEEGPDCRFDFLQINDGRLLTSHPIRRFCGIDTNIGTTIQSTHSEVYVWFHTDSSVAGYGFTITWNATNATCYDVLEPAPYGAINSPGYPGNYPRNRDCYWHIRADRGKRIQFHFATLRLEEHENCSFDFLKIYDGSRDTDPVLATYCTTVTPPPLLTSGSEALLYFHSDKYIEDTGFHISYAAVPSVHGCGGTLTTPEGSVSSPNFPDAYDRLLDCEWLIRIHPDDRIQLTFQNFTVESHSTCRFDYVEIFDGPDTTSPILGRYCGTQIPPPVLSNGNTILIKFRSDASVQHNGFKAVYKTICGGTYTDLEASFTSPYFPEPYPNKITCRYIIQLPMGNLIQLQFPFFKIEAGQTCHYDYVQVRDGISEDSPQIGQYCGSTAPDTIVSSYNELLVIFNTDRSVNSLGFYANYTNIHVGCGGVLTGMRGTIQTPDHPSSYPPSVNCNWVIRVPAGHVIRLTFETFMLEYHPNCAFDYVLITDINGVKMGKFCGLEMPPILTSTDNEMRITFVTDTSIFHDGFKAQYVALDASETCGGEYYLETGVIRSPGFPDHYPHRRMCTWILHAENGHQILLNATSFHLENHTDCRFDFLEVRNGGYETSPLIGRYCGETFPVPLISHSNVIYLTFRSDISYTAPGFEIYFDSATTGCGGTLSTPTGSIISPNYPRPYSHNAECTWLIHVSEGSIVSVVIVDADIEQHTTCYYDYLDIFDGNSENSPSLVRMCNNQQNPGPLQSSLNYMFVKFKTDSSSSGRGFHLTYHALCNNRLVGNRGVIESPNFPNPYPHNNNCTWTIVAPMGNNITLSFSHLFLENSPSCYADYLEVNETEADHKASKSLAKFCSSSDTLPPPIHTSTNIAIVRFITDSSFSSDGFRLEYSVKGCGGNIKRSYGVITSPNFPDSYPISTECIWHIKYKPGSRVSLRVTDLGLEWADNCVYDYLMVYGGADTTSPILLKLCHKLNEPVDVTSHGNEMLVHFYSDSIIVGRGFRATYTELSDGCGGIFTAQESSIASPNHPSPYNFNDECYWWIHIDEAHLVVLEFYEFSLPSSVNCTKGYIAVYDGKNTSMPLLAKLCGEMPTNPVISATGNDMLVVLEADGENVGNGFRAHYKPGCGRRILADNGGEIMTPNYPHILHSNGNCSWIISASNPGEKVTLFFTYLFAFPERCAHSAFVEVRDGDREDSPVVGRYCGTETPPAIISRGNALHITSSEDLVFRATFSITSSFCGGNLISESGSFSSPSYPDSYPMGSDCEWIITASAGNKVQLSFRYFELLDSDYCNMDFVEIHEQDASGPLIGRYCGNRIPDNVTAAHQLWIKFRSDDESTAPGFLAYFSLLYGNALNGTEGIIESPGYPKLYHQGNDYQWLITVPLNRFVSIQFLDLEINVRSGDSTCWLAVKVYDGADTESPELGSFCGFAVPEAVVSHGNQVLIQYSGTILIGKWKLQWVSVDETSMVITPPSDSSCYHEISLNSTEPAVFTSPEYPHSYPNNINCTWMITSSRFEHVKVTLLNMSIEGRPYHCFYDKVLVYTAPNPYVDSWTLNSTLCGESPNTIVESPNNVMKMMLVTDYQSSYTGFYATAETVCGSYMYGPTGHIHSTDILSYLTGHHMLSSSFVCEWVITVGTKRTIQITFDQLNLPSDGTCNTMFILLLNGGRATSPLLGNGKYCGSSVPVIPETSSNQAFIRLNVNSFARGSPQFQLHFTEISVPCGGHLYVNNDIKTVEIKSPNYPNPAPHPIECTWIVMSPAGTRMRIDFDEAFHMSSDCYYLDMSNGNVEYVELLDGGTEFSESIHRFCGSEHPSSHFTTGNVLTVKYYTALEHPNAGFKATVQAATCGGTITSQYSGYLTSPDYPANYSNSIECEWIVKMRSTFEIAIDVINIDTPPASSCALTDYLEIRAESREGEMKGLFCGNREGTALPLLVGSNVAYVKFKSDGSHTGTGFRLYFSMSGGAACGGRLTNPSGVVASPNYPAAYSGSRHCYWFIKAPLGRSVSMTFTDFNLPRDESTGVCLSSLQISNSSYYTLRQQAVSLCGNEIPQPYTTLGGTAFVMLKTSGLAAGEGFSFTYDTDRESICGGNLPIPSGTFSLGNVTHMNISMIDCSWVIDSQSDNSTVVFKFDVLDIPGSPTSACRNASLLFFKYDGAFIGRLCGNFTGQQIQVTSPYRETNLRFLSMFAQPIASILGSYHINDCGGVLDGTAAVITSPGYPNNYPPNMDCHWIIIVPYGEQIVLTTVDLRLEENCKDDYIHVLNGPHLRSPVLGQFCGTHAPAPIIADYHSLSIIFHSNDFGTAPGFKMTTTEVQHGCGGLIHATKGVITSPNYPNRYDNNVECVWTIEYRPGNLVNISFEERFDLERSEPCSNDYVLIEDYENNSWKEVAKICGQQLPAPRLSNGTKMRITFHTNSQIKGDGFKIRYSAACGGHFNEPRGVIFSPNYPEHYDNRQHCYYLVGNSKDYVSLKFDPDKFNLEYIDNCHYDYLNIYEGNSTSKFAHGPYCGENAPPQLILHGPVLIEFKSDFTFTSQGFMAEYEVAECGGIRTDVFGRINTATTAENYLNNMHCTWVIQGLANRVIALRFTKFKLEAASSCYFDYLSIYDGNSTDGTLIAKLCGEEIPPVVKSSSNQMTIIFRTDGSVTHAGFDAYYYNTYGVNQGCGDTRIAASGEITSPDVNQDGKYESNADCLWKIVGTDQQAIQITFSRFSLEPPTNGRCLSDFVDVRDGLNRDDPVIGHFCGETIPSMLVTSANKASIVFHSDGKSNMAGFAASYTSVPTVCGNTSILVTNVSQTLTSPNFPSPYPPNVYCRWHFNSYHDYHEEMQISFTELDVPCEENYIEIQSETREFEPYRHCGPAGSPLPPDFFAYYGLWIAFHSGTNNVAGKGFSATFKTADCNRNYTRDNGVVSNPGYPLKRYNTNCSVLIETVPGRTISLYFSVFEADFYHSCKDVNITVYDGASASDPTFGTFCALTLPNPIFSHGNKLFVQALSHHNSVSYMMSYTTTDKGRGCGGKMNSINGTFSSPLYPNAYNKSSDCRWELSVPSHHSMTVTFGFFQFTSSVGCETNYVELYEGFQETLSNRVGRFCSDQIPAPHTSVGSQMLVKMVTDSSNFGPGFLARFSMNKIDLLDRVSSFVLESSSEM